MNFDDIDDDFLNVPLKKPTKFKKKAIKGKTNERRTKVEHENEEEDLNVSMVNKKKFRTRQTFVKSQEKTTNASKWTIPAGLSELVDSVDSNIVVDGVPDLEEGAVLTAVDLELDNGGEDDAEPVKKYVPKLDDKLERKMSKKTAIDDIAHEYDDYNDYDVIEDKTATVKPGHSLEDEEELPNDIEIMIEDENESQGAGKMYDTQIGDSDEETSRDGIKRIFQPLPIDKEIQRLENLIKSLELENTNISTQLQSNKSQLQVIDERRNRVLEKLNSIG